MYWSISYIFLNIYGKAFRGVSPSYVLRICYCGGNHMKLSELSTLYTCYVRYVSPGCWFTPCCAKHGYCLCTFRCFTWGIQTPKRSPPMLLSRKKSHLFWSWQLTCCANITSVLSSCMVDLSCYLRAYYPPAYIYRIHVYVRDPAWPPAIFHLLFFYWWGVCFR